jgi:hypothetical protein
MGRTTVLITLHASEQPVLGASARRPILVYQTATSEEELPRKHQPVEKPLYAPSEHPSRTPKPRHCSVLVLISKCLDAVVDYPPVL